MKDKRTLIGFFPTDHNIRIFLPISAEESVIDRVKKWLSAWFNGAVTYTANATWQQQDGTETATQTRVVETHGSDAQFQEHREELSSLLFDLQTIFGSGAMVVLDIDNALQHPEPQHVYSTESAAEYLGLSVPSVKNHVHNVGDLHPLKIGSALAFTRSELDRFKSTPRPKPGRKKK